MKASIFVPFGTLTLAFLFTSLYSQDKEYRWVEYDLGQDAVHGYIKASGKCTTTAYSLYKGSIIEVINNDMSDTHAEIEVEKSYDYSSTDVNQAPLDISLCISKELLTKYTIPYQYLDIGPLALPFKLRFDANEGIQLAPGGTAGVFVGRRYQRERFKTSIGGAVTLGTTAIGSLNSEATTSKITLSAALGGVMNLTATTQAGLFVGWDVFEDFTNVPFHKGLPFISLSLGYSFISAGEQREKKETEERIVRGQLGN